MTPMTDWEQKIAKDRRAAVLFRRRRDIEKLQERRQLERDLREVYQ